MWQLSETSAVWQSGGLVLRLDLSAPEMGLDALAVKGQATSGARLLATRTLHADGKSEVVADAYIRGDDLVATYVQTAARPFRPQIYWRGLAGNDQALGGLELILSAQTSLLDADPSLSTASELPAGQVGVLVNANSARFAPLGPALPAAVTNGPGVFLFRPAGASWSYVEMVFPTDFAGAQLIEKARSPGVLQVVNSLFAERLEKGVIRRGRIRGLFLPRQDDERLAADAYSDFAASPPPLTT
jgi:hypothetical protein